MKNVTDLIGRIFIGLFFFYEAIDTMVFFKQTRETLTSLGINFAQDWLIVGSIIILLVGAVMVIIGYYANIGALLLFIYWFVFTMVVYSFWNDNSDTKSLTINFFMRNMALCGGLLILIANGAGRWSVRRILHVMRLPK
ncbi:MAG: DoxX family protein [Saprospiraceae bacterium]|nr:DoxX family protein [Bacteroidia bacterium]NNF21110.1 DoxX family protein [Saprospiraceae bacterium]NNK89447.1 DoxX family protein [Saprospiraceae bacterium]